MTNEIEELSLLLEAVELDIKNEEIKKYSEDDLFNLLNLGRLVSDQRSGYLEGSVTNETFKSSSGHSINETDRAPWYFYWGKEFRKSTEKMDRNFKGKVLDIVMDICHDPIVPRGNTIKPLEQNLKGLWRYRAEGYRLIYKPIINDRTVVFIKVENRGSVYE